MWKKNIRMPINKNIKIDQSIGKTKYWNDIISYHKELAEIYPPKRIQMCLSDICNLYCPPCHVHKINYKKLQKHGYTTLSMFEKFIKHNPHIKHICTGNGGEIFLNPDIADIFDLCSKNNIIVEIDTGSTLNSISDIQIESLVKNKIRKLTVSIDGVTQEVYDKYRIGGNLNIVFDNIKKINSLKNKYKLNNPELYWQFIVFSHNVHQIEDAKKLADSFGMKFYLRPNSFPLYDSKFNSKKIFKLLGGSNLSQIRKNKKFIQLLCSQLWISPYIFWDGQVFGCCTQKYKSFGNAFEKSLNECLKDPDYINLQNFLLGKEAELTSTNCPCFNCKELKYLIKVNF